MKKIPILILMIKHVKMIHVGMYQSMPLGPDTKIESLVSLIRLLYHVYGLLVLKHNNELFKRTNRP